MHDVLIVGGGVIGLSLAYELAGRGRRVRVLERDQPGRATSWAGAGILPPRGPVSDDDALGHLARLSFDMHARWAEDLRELTDIDNGLRRSGGLYLARD
jgi:glycine oxidase